MEIKKVFNKNIFKDKSFIKMVCFTVVMLLVLVLGSNFGYVSASGNYDFEVTSGTNYSTYENYQNSSIYNSDALNVFNITYNSDLPDISQINSLIGISYDGYTHGNNTLNLSNCPNYIAYRTSALNRINILFYADGGVVSMMNGKTSFLYSGTSSIEWAIVSVDTTNWTISNADYGVTSYSAAGLTDSNLRSYCGKNLGQNCSFLFSNSSVYAPLNSYYPDMGGGDNCFLWFKDFNNGAHTSFVDVNYQLADGLIGGNGSNGGASALNYLYADTADWWLNNDPTSQKFYNGSVTFNSSLNDYIIEHSDEYAINYDFECDIAFYYFFAPPSGQATNWQPTASCPFYKGIYGVDVEDEVEDSAFEWHYFSCHFDFDNDITDDAEDFISDGYGHRFSLYNDLYDNFDATGYLSDNTHITITPAEIIDLINGTFDGGGQLTIKQWSTFRIKCTAKIGAPSYINTSGSISDFISSASSATSGGYSETFDLLTGNSTLGDQSMLTNNNPYTELSDNTYDDTQLPSTGGTTGTTTVSTGNVTQTVNVTNEGAKYIPSLISKLIPTSIGDNTSGITERFYNLAQVNGFVTVMAETVPAVPNVIWTYCEDYLAITLYLLAVAFVLRLILDLL